MNKLIGATLVAAALLASHAAVQAQDQYPTKPIRVVIPFAGGASGTNIIARLVFPMLTERVGQQVLIDNRPGGNSTVGAEAVAKAAPDGYTLLMTVNTHLTNNLLVPNLSFDTMKDFAAVAPIAISAYLLVLHPSISANNLKELIALAKSKPGALNFASVGTGGPSHLSGVYLQMRTGIQLQQISYKGAAPAMTDVLGGHVHMLFSPPIAAISAVNAGKLKGIAITGDKRLPGISQVPTFAEAGLPKFDTSAWYAVLAPAGTPKPVIDRLSGELMGILRLPDMREQFAKQGVEPYIATPEQFAAQMQAEHATVSQIIKTANIKLQD